VIAAGKMGFPVVKMKIRKETSPLDCGLILHDRIPSLGASVDFITADGRIGEVKCPFSEEGKRSLDNPAVQAVEIQSFRQRSQPRATHRCDG